MATPRYLLSHEWGMPGELQLEQQIPELWLRWTHTTTEAAGTKPYNTPPPSVERAHCTNYSRVGGLGSEEAPVAAAPAAAGLGGDGWTPDPGPGCCNVTRLCTNSSKAATRWATAATVTSEPAGGCVEGEEGGEWEVEGPKTVAMGGVAGASAASCRTASDARVCTQPHGGVDPCPQRHQATLMNSKDTIRLLSRRSVLPA
jgi:hypothetical protein